jgi:hypothetical protein
MLPTVQIAGDRFTIQMTRYRLLGGVGVSNYEEDPTRFMPGNRCSKKYRRRIASKNWRLKSVGPLMS